MNVINLTEAEYLERVADFRASHAEWRYRGDRPAIVDFYASWCGPCRMIAPFVEEIAQENENITVGKINVDEELALATQFGITSIPTLIVMEKGQKVAQMLGYRPKADILKLLED